MISSRKEDGKHGVGFLLSENFGHCIENVKQVNEIITCLDLKLNIGVSIIQVYAPKFKIIKFRRWMTTRTSEDRAQYTIARNEAEKVKRDVKEACWGQIGVDHVRRGFSWNKEISVFTCKALQRKKEQRCLFHQRKNITICLPSLRKSEKDWKEYLEELLTEENNPE